MFVAFSGEELGLYGSSNLIRALPINPLRVNCMLNMDMVGRLDPTKKTLSVSGTGTSPFWSILDSIKVKEMEVKKSESGVGPSDHTSFYKENIPVLHFFTGMHSDYHKPSDDEPLINYQGMEMVETYIYQVLQKLNSVERLAFTKTKDTEPGEMPRYKVSLGIMPDYVFQGTGVRADGVTEGKPAQKAGIRKGDIIIAIGALGTPDMMAYTKALGQFSKGDTAPVKIIRDGVEMLVSVTF
jgi:C-terminal processing protease CtpA/Prc